jgi:GNAT superfamily N-acetyltransferase
MTLLTHPLHDHPELRPIVASWLKTEWPEWYGQGGHGNVTQDVALYADSRTKLPIGLVLFRDEEPVGFGSLKSEGPEDFAHLGPWAGAGYILPELRRKGLGQSLLFGMLSYARSIGAQRVYCATSTASSLMLRSGWLLLGHAQHGGKTVAVFESAA